MAAKTMSLVDRFDEIVASTDILVAGTEGSKCMANLVLVERTGDSHAVIAPMIDRV